MIVWDDAQQTCKDLTSDSSSASLTFFKRMMNVGYKLILADLGRPVTEKTATGVTVASQQAYQMPPDFLFIKSITVTVGSTVYTVQEEESQEYWNMLNLSAQTSDLPQVFFVRPRFGFSGAEILFYPTPASAGNTITIVYEATDKDLSQDRYSTGNVNLTEDSATVIGGNAAPVWVASVVDRYFKSTGADGDNLYYRIKTRNGATSITLENIYEGGTQSNQNYEIVEIFSLPEEMHILPVYFALHHYYAAKKEEKQEQKYVGLFRAGLQEAKIRHATKSRSEIIRPKSWMSRWGFTYPAYFPTGGINS
jgi:hypothetical protein